jgi:hypothetical protein
MDNASYHFQILNKTPTSNSKKAAIQDWLNTNKIPYEEEMLKAEVLEIVTNSRKEKEYVIDTLLTQHGHKVWRLPPYHCQFNPIELIWGIFKQYYGSHIGRDGYGDGNVKSMCLEALSTATPEIWNKSVKHIENEILEFGGKKKIQGYSK